MGKHILTVVIFIKYNACFIRINKREKINSNTNKSIDMRASQLLSPLTISAIYVAGSTAFIVLLQNVEFQKKKEKKVATAYEAHS